jgi:glycogen(starch) synthase
LAGNPARRKYDAAVAPATRRSQNAGVMNILFLTQEYPPETGMGGIGTYTRAVAHALAHAGHRIVVLSAAVPPQKTYAYEENGVHVVRVARRKFEIPILRRLWITYAPWTKHQWEYIFSVTSELSRLVRAHNIDVIEAPEIWAEGLAYSWRRRVPIVVKFHTPLFLTRQLDGMYETRDWHWVDRADAWWVRRADAYISASANLADIVAAKYHLPRAQIAVIPEAVEIECFTPAPNSTNASQTVLYVGRLEPRKGVFTLVEAIPQVLADFPEARFVFVGADYPVNGQSCRAQMLEKLRASGTLERVEFVGKLPHERIAEYHRQSAVCVFPSEWENCAIATLEAMASARPVIATHMGGFPEMIQDRVNGLLVPPHDATALAQAIKSILADPTCARTYGMRARERVEQAYSGTIVAERTLELYRAAIERFRQTRRVRH